MKPFAAVLAILALVFGLSLAFRSNGNAHPTQAELEADLVCTTCHEPLDESSSPLALQMKAQIRQKLAAGWTKDQIENLFVAQLGPQVDRDADEVECVVVLPPLQHLRDERLRPAALPGDGRVEEDQAGSLGLREARRSGERRSGHGRLCTRLNTHPNAAPPPAAT